MISFLSFSFLSISKQPNGIKKSIIPFSSFIQRHQEMNEKTTSDFFSLLCFSFNFLTAKRNQEINHSVSSFIQRHQENENRNPTQSDKSPKHNWAELFSSLGTKTKAKHKSSTFLFFSSFYTCFSSSKWKSGISTFLCFSTS